SLGEYPHVIAVNKQDVKGAVPPHKAAEIFRANSSIVMPLTAYDKESAMAVLRRLIRLIAEE
ncbi:MAG: hypothetical protein QW753_07935, partial [Thermofilum sp.]